MQQNRTNSLHEWRDKVRSRHAGHQRAGRRLGRAHWRFAIPASVLTAIVGTTIFAALEEDVNLYIKIAASVVSLLAVVFTTLQSVLRLAERAEAHKNAAAEYESIEMEITSFLDLYDASDSDLTESDARTTVDMIKKRIQDANARAPALDPRDETAQEDAPHRRADAGATAARPNEQRSA